MHTLVAMLTTLGSSFANVIEADAEVLSRSGRCTPRYFGCFRDDPAIESETYREHVVGTSHSNKGIEYLAGFVKSPTQVRIVPPHIT